MDTFAGIDLHGNNNFIGVIDQDSKRLYAKRHSNNMDSILKVLKPFKSTLKGVVVESTYNWYWLIDGLQDNGYTVHLANPAAIKTYDGLKHTNDKWDSFWLAHMLRLNLLPTGYIYPKAERPTRDLLRRRLMFVRQRTAHILSLQSMISRNNGANYSGAAIKQFTERYAKKFFTSPQHILTAKNNISTIQFFNDIIKVIEKEVMEQVKLKKEFQMIRTIPGIGPILGLTIMLEVGNIKRFPKAGNYSSYCRCVESRKISNGKKKGQNNKKNGNKYLSWAYVEGSNFAIRYCSYCQKFFQRKMSKSSNNRVLAIKALANKLSKASFYLMRDQVPYDPKKLFCS